MQKQNSTKKFNYSDKAHLRIVEEYSQHEIVCPKCNSSDLKKNGFNFRKSDSTKKEQRYRCKKCKKDFSISGLIKKQEYQLNSISCEELGIPYKPHHRSKSVGLNKLYQPWLRREFVRFIRFIASYSEFGSIVNHTSHMNRFSRFLLDRYQNITINELNRTLILEYLSTLKGLKHARQYISSLKLFLDTGTANGWFTIPPYLITDDDYPKRIKPLPRYIPEGVMRQLNQHLDKLPTPVMRMSLVHQECGFRISELVTLRLDCLKQTTNGDYFVLYTNWKLKKEDTKPISPELVAVIKEQQEYIRSNLNDFDYLFCGRKHYQEGSFKPPEEFIPKAEPMRKARFSEYLKKLAHDYNIVDSNGKVWNFQSHQFRHTVATRMINSGVPLHIIQRYLGHESPEMTMIYARIHDDTLKKEIEKYHESRVVNFQGETAELDETTLSSSDDLEWFKKKVQGRALEHGYCARPQMLGDCDIPGFDGCYACPHWRTNKNFLPVLEDTLKRTNNVLQKAKNYGWQLQINKNTPIRDNLEKVLKSLVEDNDQ